MGGPARGGIMTDDAVCISCGAGLGVVTVPSAPPARSIGDWTIIADLPGGAPDAELFLARRSAGETASLLRLLPCGLEPEASIYSVIESLDHPSIPRLLAHGRSEDRVHEVFEHIEGPTLTEIASDLGRDPEGLEHAAGALIGALTLFERRRLRHGNLQPSVI